MTNDGIYDDVTDVRDELGVTNANKNVCITDDET